MALLHSEKSLNFDNTNDLVAIGNVSELSFEKSDAFTLSAWVKVNSTSSTGDAIIGKFQGSSPFRGWLLTSIGTLTLIQIPHQMMAFM